MSAGPVEGDDEITGINVTPLVDVMLVLLIIFMVTANYIVNHSIGLQLPKAATGGDPGPVNLAFSIDKNGQLFMNGEAIEYDNIKALIEAEKAKGKPVQALIAADQGTMHGEVVKLIDAVRKNGITDFAINVEAESR
jgi:biopolymer transport protein ExbD